MAEDDSKDDEQEKPKSKLLFIIIGVLILLLVGGGVAAFLMLSGGDDKGGASESEEIVQKPAIYFDFKPPFVVNYQWKGRQRYVQISISIMTRNEVAIETLQKHMPLVKNNLVMIMGSQDFEILRTPEGKDAVRQGILEELQKILTEEMGDPGVEQVLFTNFVMQ